MRKRLPIRTPQALPETLKKNTYVPAYLVYRQSVSRTWEFGQVFEVSVSFNRLSLLKWT